MSEKKSGKGHHSFTGTILNWQYCTKCGLITLKNKKTSKAMRQKCKGSEDYD